MADVERRNDADLDDDDLLLEELERDDDAMMASLREARMGEIQAETAKRQMMRENNHGVCDEVLDEKALMDMVTSTAHIVIHFFHKDFRRCDIMDKHLKEVAAKYYTTKFVKINVDNAPFLVVKLQVKILPCVLCFIDGNCVDRIIGFEELGNTDAFQTASLEFRLGQSGVVKTRANTITIGTKKKSIFGNEDSGEDDDDD
ncbi:hypothetical protein BZG36_02751 [Bifiguratus adelaidae]|uniref:Phosducin domain-containing protein n=1 Tax=Bifiguratus adelaidae TaxID=1938954 RepID=A0A261XYM4_9FUNG|nr:hypothetical protein BZG36_02751 [Bifiguratus adelaidae]